MSEDSQVLLDRFDGRLSGELDLAAAPTAEVDFLALARRTDRATFELDCRELTFIDSAGVQMLERVATRSGKQVHISNLRSGCRRVFEILDRCEKFGIPSVRDEPGGRGFVRLTPWPATRTWPIASGS